MSGGTGGLDMRCDAAALPARTRGRRFFRHVRNGWVHETRWAEEEEEQEEEEEVQRGTHAVSRSLTLLHFEGLRCMYSISRRTHGERNGLPSQAEDLSAWIGSHRWKLPHNIGRPHAGRHCEASHILLRIDTLYFGAAAR